MDNTNSQLLKQYATKHRMVLSTYGSNVGKQIYSVEEANTDLKAGQNMREANESHVIFLNHVTKHYVIRRMDILKVELALTANDKPVIILNGGTEQAITCNIGKPEFDRKVSTVSVREAIEHKKENGAPIYFSDIDALTSEVNRLNADNMKDIDNLVEYLQNQKKVLINDTAINNSELMKYHSECDGEDDVISATITVATSEE